MGKNRPLPPKRLTAANLFHTQRLVRAPMLPPYTAVKVVSVSSDRLVLDVLDNISVPDDSECTEIKIDSSVPLGSLSGLVAAMLMLNAGAPIGMIAGTACGDVPNIAPSALGLLVGQVSIGLASAGIATTGAAVGVTDAAVMEAHHSAKFSM